MGSKNGSPKELSLWEQLPKAEQERIRRSLNEKRTESPKQPQRKAGTFNLRGYVRCELSASDKEAFKAWEEGQDEAACYGRLIKAVDSGYLLKVGEQGGGFQASLSANTTNQSWDGYVLVAHAGHAARAVMLLVYKHEVLAEQDWSAWVDEGGEDSFR